MTSSKTPTLLAYRNFLSRLLETAEGGAATLELAGQAADALDRVPLGLDDIAERLRKDPDVSGLSSSRRADAVCDYLRVAIGAIDRAVAAERLRPTAE